MALLLLGQPDLAMIVLWTGAVFLHKFGYPPIVLHDGPARHLHVRGVRDLLLPGPECLGLSTSIAYPVGIVAAALFLVVFIWRTLIVGKNDVAPLARAAK